MTDPQVAVLMLGSFILVILLGFPICFTLMGMGVIFGYYAYYDAERMRSIWDNQIFDLLVNQSYSVMANDVLTAVPLFLLMGYIVERANIVDRLFYTLHIAARRLPGSMALAALLTCALFATATGIVGAVVTLMGLLAFPQMLKARYNTSFAAGVICAGGCLGILIPPSIMLIVYGATANVSVVRLYAGALLPGFLLAGLYMVYVLGRSLLNPNLAPKPRPEDIPDVSGGQVAFMMLTSFIPLAVLILSVLGAILFGLATPTEAAAVGALGGLLLAFAYRIAAISQGTEEPEWSRGQLTPLEQWLYAIGYGGIATIAIALIYIAARQIMEMFTGRLFDEPGTVIQPGVGIALSLIIALIIRFFGTSSRLLRTLQPDQAVIQRIFVFGGSGGVVGLLVGAVYVLGFKALGLDTVFFRHQVNYFGFDIGFLVGLGGWLLFRVNDQDRLRESIYLTVRTSAMVCWLFVGSWTFASVFSYLGGEKVIEEFVLGMNLTPIMFLILTQFIIFLLGWPLEWSEIIIIFVPIFLPLLPHFGVDPLFFGILVALNLQTSFLTPPMAMAAYYLKGIAPPHVQLVDIFRGVLPFLSMVLIAMMLLYTFPEIAFWLPGLIYGR